MGDSKGVLAEVAELLGDVFRHLLPGVLVLGGAKLAYPKRLQIDVNSWEHIFVVGVITIALGNVWFALNRYGIHQIVDYVLYLFKFNGPARRDTHAFFDDLGKYTYRSLHGAESSKRARQHVAFRASTVLLCLTVSELLLIFRGFHEQGTVFAHYPHWVEVGAVFAFLVALLQMAITRRIDYYVVNPPISEPNAPPQERLRVPIEVHDKQNDRKHRS